MTERNAVFAWLRQCFAIIPEKVKVHELWHFDVGDAEASAVCLSR